MTSRLCQSVFLQPSVRCVGNFHVQDSILFGFILKRAVKGCEGQIYDQRTGYSFCAVESGKALQQHFQTTEENELRVCLDIIADEANIFKAPRYRESVYQKTQYPDPSVPCQGSAECIPRISGRSRR